MEILTISLLILMSRIITRSAVDKVTLVFQDANISISAYIIRLLEDSTLKGHPQTLDLLCSATDIITAISQQPDAEKSALSWASNAIKKKYLSEMKSLVKNQEWQFNASHASAEKLDNFRIEGMALAMKGLAPDVWAMLDLLLMGDRKAFETGSTADYDGDQVMLNSETIAAHGDGLDHGEEFGENLSNSQGYTAEEAAQISDSRTSSQIPSRHVTGNIARQDAICTIVS
jgi:hypothetical protein